MLDGNIASATRIAFSIPLALLMVSSYSFSGTESHTMPAPPGHKLYPDENDRTDRNAGIHIAAEAEITDGARIRASCFPFQLRNNPHGP